MEMEGPENISTLGSTSTSEQSDAAAGPGPFPGIPSSPGIKVCTPDLDPLQPLRSH